ncbi:hypothetical protein O181_069908 [Austropuccinia psidii MF-1]|uniref:Uncharacterized protein n=1 Tax=Austropuccinia psidii MF-1 TaxID=1389203 RepID=A0A9Q3EY30_9BASI|nr:hypothetical protein [Austropuccinia psidii MF-1]
MDFFSCPNCREHSVTTADGRTCHGRFFHPSTRRRHWAMESAKQDLSVRNEFAPQYFLNEIEEIPMPHSQDDEESNRNGEDHEPNTHGIFNLNIIYLAEKTPANQERCLFLSFIVSLMEDYPTKLSYPTFHMIFVPFPND